MTGTRRYPWGTVAVLVVSVLILAVATVPFLVGSSDPVDADLRNSAAFIQDNLWPGDEHEYVVLISVDGTPFAGRRPITGGDWELFDLSTIEGNPLGSPTTEDRHNVYAIAEGPDGRVHVIGNVHAEPLRYVRTVVPGEFDQWEAATVAGPTEETTYPRFVQRRDGELLFLRRDGFPGNGDLVIDALDADGTWTHVAKIIDGRATDESAYLNRVAYDSDRDRIHLFFTWRDQIDVGTNRDVGHMMSDDGGRTWKSIDGAAIALPARHDQHTTVIDTGLGSGLVNSGGAVLDRAGRPFAALERRGDDGRELVVVHHDGERWQETVHEWSLAGRPALAVDGEGDVWALGRRGSSIVAVDVANPDRSVEFGEASIPTGWEVALDSRSMEQDGVVRTLVPDDRTPRVIELFG